MNKRYLLELLEKFVANLRADIDHENQRNESTETNLCTEIPSKRIKKEHVSLSTFEGKIKFLPQSNSVEMDNFLLTVVDKRETDLKVKRESLQLKEEIFGNDFLDVGISTPNSNQDQDQDVQTESTPQTSGRKNAGDAYNNKGEELPGPSRSNPNESLNDETGIKKWSKEDLEKLRLCRKNAYFKVFMKKQEHLQANLSTYIQKEWLSLYPDTGLSPKNLLKVYLDQFDPDSELVLISDMENGIHLFPDKDSAVEWILTEQLRNSSLCRDCHCHRDSFEGDENNRQQEDRIYESAIQQGSHDRLKQIATYWYYRLRENEKLIHELEPKDGTLQRRLSV